jgi:DNA-binding LacI/PurR family transcriptional regulator
MANIKQIDKLARVSLATVSHVLNDSAKVREPLRRRVLDAVFAAGYQPGQLSRALRDAGIETAPCYLQETTFDRAGGYSKTKVLLRTLPRPPQFWHSTI